MDRQFTKLTEELKAEIVKYLHNVPSKRRESLTMGDICYKYNLSLSDSFTAISAYHQKYSKRVC